MALFTVKSHIAGSPFKCEVDYPHDISKVSVVGMPQNVPLGSPVEFEVNAENVKTAPITCVLPSGNLFLIKYLITPF